MKKFLALLLMAVMALTVLTGCSDPVYDDLSNFLNVEMKDVNADYTKITTEVGTWENFTDDADIINPATEEVIAIKDKYVKVMDAYKAGFEGLSEGCTTQDEATIDAATAKLEEAVVLLDEYNKALEELAKEHGSEVEY